MNSASGAGQKKKRKRKEEGKCRRERGTRNSNRAYNVIFGLVRLLQI